MNLKEQAVTVFGLLFAVSCLAICAFMIGCGGIFGIFLGLPFALVAGYIFARFVGSWVGDSLGFGLFLPKHVRETPSEYPLIRAKINRNELDEAIADIENALEKNPGNYELIVLLSEVFIDKKQDYAKAVGLLTAYLEKPDRSSRDLPLVMSLVDAYLELGHDPHAVALLQRECHQKYPKKQELDHLRTRLESFQATLSE